MELSSRLSCFMLRNVEDIIALKENLNMGIDNGENTIAVPSPLGYPVGLCWSQVNYWSPWLVKAVVPSICEYTVIINMYFSATLLLL